MAKNNNLQDFLTDVANSIRTKTQTTDPINAQDFSDKILSIQTGGGENTLKNLLDATKNTHYLFENYKGASIDGLISYDDTENVTDMTNMFRKCSNLTTIPLFNTSNVAIMENMFYDCSKLIRIPSLNTDNLTTIYGMFNGCSKLQEIPLLNTSKIRYMSNLFYGCSSLVSIPLLDTSNVEYMYQTFGYCSNLIEIPALDVSKVTNFDSTFIRCSKLSAIHMTGMKTSFDISASTKFTSEALHEIIGNLATVTSSQTLTMGATNLAKLTEEDKAIATNKG